MEQHCWDLTPLYPSFEGEAFQHDKKKLKEKIGYLTDWAHCNFADTNNQLEKLETYITQQNALGDLASRLLEYASLRLSTNSSDETALKLLDQLEEQLSQLTAPQVAFEKWLAALPNLDTVIAASPLLKTHAFYLSETINHAKHTISNAEEVVLSHMKTTGSQAWGKLQETVTANHLVPILLDGEMKSLPLAEIRNYAYDKNEAIRKAAYEAELASYEAIAWPCAFSLNSLKGEVLYETQIRGYTSPLSMTLSHSRMDEETLMAMFTAIEESLPIFQQYFLKKASLLGYSNGLPFYNLFAPMGEADWKFTYEEAQAFIIEHFSAFSQKLGDYAAYAFAHRWIDVYPRQGKRGGAFCSNLHSIGESRILTNFSGTLSDVITIAHELGHGYHGACLDSQTYLNSDYPMPIAETASTFCETLVKNAALKKASPEEAFMILETDLSDHSQVIVDIYSRFLFEDAVFQKRPAGFLSPNELSQMMLTAQKKAYGKGLDETFLHPYMWICKSHYYDAEYNYYNFPYAFGLLLAKGLYAQYEAEGDRFLTKYDQLLSATGSASLKDVAAYASIDLHSAAFWKQSLKMIEQDISKFLTIGK